MSDSQSDIWEPPCVLGSLGSQTVAQEVEQPIENQKVLWFDAIYCKCTTYNICETYYIYYINFD